MAAPPGLNATADGIGGLTVGQYTEDPLSTPAIGATGAYFDVADSTDNAFTSLTLDDCDLAGGNTVEWWNQNTNNGGWRLADRLERDLRPGHAGLRRGRHQSDHQPEHLGPHRHGLRIGAVNQVPSFTSPTTANGTIGQPMSFTITTVGFPTPR